jgi:hypothetical protein
LAAALVFIYGVLALIVTICVWALISFHFKLAVLRLTTVQYLEAQDAVAFGAEEEVPELSATRKIISKLRSPKSAHRRSLQFNHSIIIDKLDEGK